MNPMPDVRLVPYVKRLAELFDSESGTQSLAMLQFLQATLASLSGAMPRGVPAEQSAPLPRVGIWSARAPGVPDGLLVRSEAANDQWRYWADVEAIPLRGAKPRVILIGESVARGYFYDPCFTPAQLLQRMLRMAPGLEQAEVVDLARNDLTLGGVLALVREASLLQPDLIVVFAGNNWHGFDTLGMDDSVHLARLIRQAGITHARGWFYENKVATGARRLLDALAQLRSRTGVNSVVVVPEFNLKEWRTERDVLAPVMPGAANARWLRLHTRAERALSGGRLEQASILAAQLIALDGGCSSASWALAGQCHALSGDMGAARAAFESARDAVCGFPLPLWPRCPGVIRNTLRTGAVAQGFGCVDVASALEEHPDGGLPDRRWFLDYCHMTLKGLQYTLALTARAAMQALGANAPDLEELESLDPQVSCEAQATACFLAAIHCAHYGQREPLVRGLCEDALALQPSIAELMTDFIEVQARKAPHWMCAAFRGMTRNPQVMRYMAPWDTRRTEKLAEFAFSRAICAALENVGIEVRGRLAELEMQEHALGDSPVDLLQGCYRAQTPRERQGFSLGAELAYVKAYGQVSNHFLVLRAQEDLKLQLTARLPEGTPRRAYLRVLLNDKLVRRIKADEDWRSFHISVGRVLTRVGLNLVTVQWPLRKGHYDSHCRRAALQVERLSPPDVLPTFGELFALTVSRA